MSSTGDMASIRARTRLHHIGLSQRDTLAIQSLLRLRPELDARYEFIANGVTGAHILFVNADDHEALAAWEQTRRQQPALRAVMVSRQEQAVPGHPWLHHPIDFRNFISLLDSLSSLDSSPATPSAQTTPEPAARLIKPSASRPLRVLIVDDSHPARVFLQHKLKQLTDLDIPLSVETAEDGMAALERVGKQHYDLILLDVNMPGLDGHETCRRLKQIRPVRVVMLTGRHEPADRPGEDDAGGDHYLTKPPQDDQLRQVLMLAAAKSKPVTV